MKSVLLTLFVVITLSQAAKPGVGCGSCELPDFQGDKANTTLYGTDDEELVASNTMNASYVGQCVNVPFNTLFPFFSQPRLWCIWNGLFGSVKNENITVGDNLVAAFNIMPNVTWPQGTSLKYPEIKLVNSEEDYAEYAWIYEFSDQSGNILEFGRHNYAVGDIGGGKSCLVSWEKAAGGQIFSSIANEVQYTLDCATKAAMDGVRCLETTYMSTGGLYFLDVFNLCAQWTGFGCKKSPDEVTDCLSNTYPANP